MSSNSEDIGRFFGAKKAGGAQKWKKFANFIRGGKKGASSIKKKSVYATENQEIGEGSLARILINVVARNPDHNGGKEKRSQDNRSIKNYASRSRIVDGWGRFG